MGWRRDAESASRKEQRADEHVQTSDLLAAAADVAMVRSEDAGGSGSILSEGSKGHPHSCATPCRYVRRKFGCRNGAACPDCHICVWRRGLGKDVESPDDAAGSKNDIFDESRETLQTLINNLIKSKECECVHPTCLPCHEPTGAESL